MSKIVSIPEKMYGIPLRIYIGSYRQYAEYCSKRYHFPPEPQRFFGGESFTLTFENGKAEVFIWLEDFSIENVADLGLLSHECNHAALRILDRVGIKTKHGNEEPLCYLQEYFFTEAIKKLTGGKSPANQDK